MVDGSSGVKVAAATGYCRVKSDTLVEEPETCFQEPLEAIGGFKLACDPMGLEQCVPG